MDKLAITAIDADMVYGAATTLEKHQVPGDELGFADLYTMTVLGGRSPIQGYAELLVNILGESRAVKP